MQVNPPCMECCVQWSENLPLSTSIRMATAGLVAIIPRACIETTHAAIVLSQHAPISGGMLSNVCCMKAPWSPAVGSVSLVRHAELHRAS